jgi:hypothetical protein
MHFNLEIAVAHYLDDPVVRDQSGDMARRADAMNLFRPKGDCELSAICS